MMIRIPLPFAGRKQRDRSWSVNKRGEGVAHNLPMRAYIKDFAITRRNFVRTRFPWGPCPLSLSACGPRNLQMRMIPLKRDAVGRVCNNPRLVLVNRMEIAKPISGIDL